MKIPKDKIDVVSVEKYVYFDRDFIEGLQHADNI